MTSTDLDATSVESRAKIFSALSDPIRLAIMDELSDDPRCVCDLQQVVDIAPNLLSYHLRVLRESQLVEATRRGRWVDYRLADDAARLVGDGLPAALGAGMR